MYVELLYRYRLENKKGKDQGTKNTREARKDVQEMKTSTVDCATSTRLHLFDIRKENNDMLFYGLTHCSH